MTDQPPGTEPPDEQDSGGAAASPEADATEVEAADSAATAADAPTVTRPAFVDMAKTWAYDQGASGESAEADGPPTVSAPAPPPADGPPTVSAPAPPLAASPAWTPPSAEGSSVEWEPAAPAGPALVRAADAVGIPADRPEFAVAAAFVAGVGLALILKRLGR